VVSKLLGFPNKGGSDSNQRAAWRKLINTKNDGPGRGRRRATRSLDDEWVQPGARLVPVVERLLVLRGGGARFDTRLLEGSRTATNGDAMMGRRLLFVRCGQRNRRGPRRATSILLFATRV
jgi:hypothetical protein